MSRKSRREAGKREVRARLARDAADRRRHAQHAEWRANARRREAARLRLYDEQGREIEEPFFGHYPSAEASRLVGFEAWLLQTTIVSPEVHAALKEHEVQKQLDNPKPSREAVLLLTKRALEAAFPDRSEDLMREIEKGWAEGETYEISPGLVGFRPRAVRR